MSDRWTVEWESLTTQGDLLVLMLTQVGPHLEAAIRSGEAILAGQFNVENASAFLFSAAVSGDFFWPSERRARAIREAFPNLSRDMRHLVGIPDEPPESLDLIRNDVTHVDERLEEEFLKDREPRLLAWGNGKDAAEGTRRYMNFDPETGVLHSLGRELSVPELVEWLKNVRARVGKVLLPLMLKSPALGGADA